MNKYLQILFFLILTQSGYSQFFPKEKAEVNYRLVGFEVPIKVNIAKYTLEIADDIITDEEIFSKNIRLVNSSDKNKQAILLPRFNCHYTWRVIYYDGQNNITWKSDLHHFRTGTSPAINTAVYGLRIEKQVAEEHNDMLLLCDYVLAIYQMDGSPVWYPGGEVGKLAKPDVKLRDFKPTHAGTFTALLDTIACEFDYDGNILWKSPAEINKNGAGYYHHELTRLDNGHYMVAGSERIFRKIPGKPDAFFNPGDSSVIKTEDGRYYKGIISGTIIEYDAAGKIVWMWRASDHFTDKEYFRLKKDLLVPFNGCAYLNGFEFDERNKVLYVSFRDINRIVKVDYLSGAILDMYGEVVNNDLSITMQSPFYNQHCIRIDKYTNHLYLFNNNVCNTVGINSGSVSHITLFGQGKRGLEPLWDYACDTVSPERPLSSRLGSVALLKDECILVNMGIASRMFIVDTNKRILWNAIPYVKNGVENLMTPYRINHIPIDDIGRFVFHKSEKRQKSSIRP